jgi:PilZ domain
MVKTANGSCDERLCQMTTIRDRAAGEFEDRRKISDRRSSSRKRMVKAARTYWPNGDSSECTVLNLSETGAKLELHGPVPQKFEIVIDGEGLRRPCVVVWRREKTVGIKFDGNTDKPVLTRKSKYAHYADACRLIAEHSSSSHREILLEMAEAWTKVAPRRRNKNR